MSTISHKPEALRTALWWLLHSSDLNNDRASNSNVVDVIVTRAFIAASENALCGAHQKGKVFKAHKFDMYVALIKE
jgi:hypothetical protein